MCSRRAYRGNGYINEKAVETRNSLGDPLALVLAPPAEAFRIVCFGCVEHWFAHPKHMSEVQEQ